MIKKKKNLLASPVAAHRLSSCSSPDLELMGFNICGTLAVAPQHVESSCVPGTGRQILSHCTTRGSPVLIFIYGVYCRSPSSFYPHRYPFASTCFPKKGISQSGALLSPNSQLSIWPISLFILMPTVPCFNHGSLTIENRQFTSSSFFFFKYLFLWLHQVLAVARRTFGFHCSIKDL